jgi:transposase-like protein
MAGYRSDEEPARWVSRWRASGLGCERFAREHGLAPSTLYNWAQKFEGVAGDEDAVKFAEVRVVGAAIGSMLELQLPNGCVVRVNGAVDEGQLRNVIRATSEC